MSKVPEQIHVGPIVYDVLVTKKGYTHKDTRYYGETDFRSSTIRLHPKNSEGVNKATLFHELIHCWFEQSNLKFDGDTEEDIIRAIEHVAVDTLSRPENAELREFLFNAEV